jgi:hypothetical protein
LNIIDQEAGTIRQVNSPQSFRNSYARCLFEDSHGRIWIAIAGGLAMIDVKAGVVTNFLVSNGLSDMSISGVRERDG